MGPFREVLSAYLLEIAESSCWIFPTLSTLFSWIGFVLMMGYGLRIRRVYKPGADCRDYGLVLRPVGFDVYRKSVIFHFALSLCSPFLSPLCLPVVSPRCVSPLCLPGAVIPMQWVGVSVLRQRARVGGKRKRVAFSPGSLWTHQSYPKTGGKTTRKDIRVVLFGT